MKKVAIVPALLIVLATSASANTKAIQNAQQHFEKANELLKRMDYEGAIAEYNKVVELSADSEIAQDAQYWIGQSHFRAGRFDTAQATFAKLIETHPTSAIVPVTTLMVERVEQAKKTEAIRAAMSDTASEGYVIDPDTGVKYTKAATFTGKNDVIEYVNKLNRSPNGKFLLWQKLVVPIDGSEPFDLVDHPHAWGGVWSPDGTRVAFYLPDAICIVPVSPETGRPTGPVQKLREGLYISGPLVSWSPDGQKLSFIKGYAIWILSVADGSLTQIRDGGAFGEAQWSPDGKTILYGLSEDGDARRSLCTISGDGGGLKVVASLGSSGLSSLDWCWSPDGRWILYHTGNRAYLLNVDDSRKLDLAATPREIGDFFCWSPNRKKMLFYRESYDYEVKLKLISTSGGPPLDIGKRISPCGSGIWSPDSKMIAIGGRYDDRKNAGIWIIRISGGEPVPLEVDVSVDGEPVVFEVSPDGQRLAFVVEREAGAKDLYVVPVSLKAARSTGPAVKAFEGWHPRYPTASISLEAAWSPDGSKLAVVHENEIWIASSNEDKPVQLTHNAGAFYPGWSPDGTMVDYMAWPKHDPEGGLYVTPSGGGSPAKVRASERASRGWSPDSKKVAVVSGDSILAVTVPDGQTQEIVTLKDLRLARVWFLNWSPDGKYITCDGLGESGESSPLMLIPVAGGKPTMLAASDDKSFFYCSPNGKWIAYCSWESIKVRPEGILWEADFEEIVKSASRQVTTDTK